MGRKSIWTETKNKYGIRSNVLFKKIKINYETPEAFESAIEARPYDILIDVLGQTFNKADAFICSNFPSMRTSKERCVRCCMYLLKKVESEGQTVISANEIARMLKRDFPETFEHVVDAIKNDDRFYYYEDTKKVSLKQTYISEKTIAETILEKVNNPTMLINVDWEKYTSCDGIELTDEQSQILKAVCENNIVMLNGSAGCGKTSAMKALVNMIYSEEMTCDIVAPTGIAAKRIAESTNHYASTIHRYVGARTGRKGNLLGSADFIIIDEMSMVGVHLLASLFRVLDFDTKIVFICDESQLASISCGNVVQDVIDSGIVPMVKLTKVFRYGKGGIATVATDIRMGKPLNGKTEFNDYKFVNVSSSPLDDITKEYNILRQRYEEDEIMILSPFNVRDSGTYAINREVQRAYKDGDVIFSMKKGSDVIEFKIDDRVVNTENNYHVLGEDGNEVGIMNGDIGRIVGREFNYDLGADMFVVEFDCGKVYLETDNMYKLLLGYSITIHKSQGSQAKAVIVIADKSHGFFLTRNLMYVACSRAQKELVLIGDINAINNSLKTEENKERETMLKTFLTNGI